MISLHRAQLSSVLKFMFRAVRGGSELGTNRKLPDIDLGSIARSAPVLSSSPERSVPVVTDAEVRILGCSLALFWRG